MVAAIQRFSDASDAHSPCSSRSRCQIVALVTPALSISST
jgi:hypothetical protein